MSHCEWRPIDELAKWAGDNPIYTWDDGNLIEIVWSSRHKEGALSWCQLFHERDGDEVYRLDPQPKFYLKLTPPEES